MSIVSAAQDLINAYDQLPAIAKQGVAVALGFAFVALAHAPPGTVPDACGNIAATGLGSDCRPG